MLACVLTLYILLAVFIIIDPNEELEDMHMDDETEPFNSQVKEIVDQKSFKDRKGLLFNI